MNVLVQELKNKVMDFALHLIANKLVYQHHFSIYVQLGMENMKS